MTRAYMVLLHLALIAAVGAALAVSIMPAWFDLGRRSRILAAGYEARVSHQARRAAQMGSAAVAVFGDSIVEDMAATRVVPCAENFGIGGDTVAEVGRRLARVGVGGARAVVVHAGLNDWETSRFARLGADYTALLNAVPAHIPVVASAMLPVDAGRAPRFREAVPRLAEANAVIRAACERRPGCRFVDTGPALAGPDGALRAELSIGDGVHLNAAGYRIVAERLRPAVLAAAPAIARDVGCGADAPPAPPPPRG